MSNLLVISKINFLTFDECRLIKSIKCGSNFKCLIWRKRKSNAINKVRLT
jgi:hypothetical protein